MLTEANASHSPSHSPHRKQKGGVKSVFMSVLLFKLCNHIMFTSLQSVHLKGCGKVLHNDVETLVFMRDQSELCKHGSTAGRSESTLRTAKRLKVSVKRVKVRVRGLICLDLKNKV